MAYFGGSSRMSGDPGLFDVFKRIGGAVLKGALGIPGAVISEVISGRKPPPRGTAAFIPPETAIAIGSGAAAFAGPLIAQRAARTGACPPGLSGYHLNKSSYFLRDGTFVPEGTRMVRNRSRNPYNKRAATRAASRLQSLGRGMKTIRKSVKAAAKEIG